MAWGVDVLLKCSDACWSFADVASLQLQRALRREGGGRKKGIEEGESEQRDKRRKKEYLNKCAHCPIFLTSRIRSELR